VSVRPISYICRFPKQVQKETGRPANTTRRTREEVREGVKKWFENKYHKRNKRRCLARLDQGKPWTNELVIHKVKSKDEVTHQQITLIRRLRFRVDK
jgi:hypothetical protein